MNNDVAKTNQNLPATIYKPSELLGMFTAYLSRQDVNSQVIYLRGIYPKNPKHDPRWTYRYDILRDVDTQTEITLQMTQKQSEEHMKKVEKSIIREYKPRMKKLTYSQGKLLIKLIYRECDSQSYDIVKAFLGPVKAGFYQAFASLFGASLKKGYDPEGTDRLTERVVLMVEAGQL